MNTDIRLKLSERIRGLRKKCGYTQDKLAEIAGIDYKHLQLLESKHPSAATIITIEKLAKALKVSPSELLDFK